MNKIWKKDDYSIAVLTKSTGLPLRLLADKVAGESPYDHCYFDPQDPVDPHTFLALHKEKPVGFLQMDIRNHDYSVPTKWVHPGHHYMWK